ncbi:MAG: hypothetical protein E7560_00690 [Ruminococcaceae bacterium]|nr:hypothetical protein [Oscillospiraceae bacterium]
MSEIYSKTTVESEWGAMLSLAKVYFESYSQKKYEYHQCLVLTTANGEQAVCPITANSVDALKSQACSYIESLIKKYKDNSIKKIICMWENNTIDVPSLNFMKKLCETNKENRNAIVLLNAGTDVYIAKKIVDII